MTDHPKFDLAEAFNRALEARRDFLKTKNHWRELSGIPKTTGINAFSGGNATIDTLTKLAVAAKMTVGELLDYGEPDWKERIKARKMANALIKELGQDDSAESAETIRQNLTLRGERGVV